MSNRSPTTKEVQTGWIASTARGFTPENYARFDAWLAAHDREVTREAARKAWDEGHRSAVDVEAGAIGYDEDTNPYEPKEEDNA